MTGNIIRFRRPPYAVLDGGIVTMSDVPAEIGTRRIFIELHDPDDGSFVVWDGESYPDALAQLHRLRGDGVRTVDLLSGGVA